jgi:FkbM family methyltransferase
MIPRAARVFEKLPRTLRRHRLMKGWMQLTREDPLQLVRIRDDSFAYADLADGFLRLIVIDGNFEHDFFRIADALFEKGGVLLDVGANHGLLSFGLAGRHGDKIKFHLFEPNPKLVESIKRSRAGYPLMDLRLNAAAVSDREGTVSFFIDHGQTGASHISNNGGYKVDSITLDKYLADANIEQVWLLKLDVEGYELPALRGATRHLENHAIGAIYFEYFEKCLIRVQQPRELLQFLDSRNYEVCFCRSGDLEGRGGPTHTIVKGLPGNGLPLLPIAGHAVPSMTDLLAVPKENLSPLLI